MIGRPTGQSVRPVGRRLSVHTLRQSDRQSDEIKHVWFFRPSLRPVERSVYTIRSTDRPVGQTSRTDRSVRRSYRVNAQLWEYTGYPAFFNSNNFTTSESFAEVCALLNTILDIIFLSLLSRQMAAQQKIYSLNQVNVKQNTIHYMHYDHATQKLIKRV